MPGWGAWTLHIYSNQSAYSKSLVILKNKTGLGWKYWSFSEIKLGFLMAHHLWLPHILLAMILEWRMSRVNLAKLSSLCFIIWGTNTSKSLSRRIFHMLNSTGGMSNTIQSYIPLTIWQGNQSHTHHISLILKYTVSFIYSIHPEVEMLYKIECPIF